MKRGQTIEGKGNIKPNKVIDETEGKNRKKEKKKEKKKTIKWMIEERNEWITMK